MDTSTMTTPSSSRESDILQGVQNASVMLLLIIAVFMWWIQKRENDAQKQTIEILQQECYSLQKQQTCNKKHDPALVKQIKTLQSRIQQNQQIHKDEVKRVRELYKVQSEARLQHAKQESKAELEARTKEWSKCKNQLNASHELQLQELMNQIGKMQQDTIEEKKQLEKQLQLEHHAKEKTLLDKISMLEQEKQSFRLESQEFHTPMSSREQVVNCALGHMFDTIAPLVIDEHNDTQVTPEPRALTKLNQSNGTTLKWNGTGTNNSQTKSNGKHHQEEENVAAFNNSKSTISSSSAPQDEATSKATATMPRNEAWEKENTLEPGFQKTSTKRKGRSTILKTTGTKKASTAIGSTNLSTRSLDTHGTPTKRAAQQQEPPQINTAALVTTGSNHGHCKKRSPIIHCHASEKNHFTMKQVLKRIKDTTVTKVSCQGTATDNDVVLMCQYLCQKKCALVSLVLTNCGLTVVAAAALSTLLETNETIEELDLSNNLMGVDGVVALVEPLVLHNKTLVRLVLQDNHLSAKCSSALGRLLRHNTTLVDLRLGGSSLVGHFHFGHRGIKILAPDLYQNTTLENLGLNHNKLGQKGAATLATKVLKENSTIGFLDLTCNHVGHKGTDAIATVLLDDKVIHSLSLESNDMGTLGAHSLVCVLRFNSTLKWLKLGNNMIGDDGAVALAGGLEDNAALEVLYLDWNGIDNPGTKALACSLRTNNTLKKLDLSANQIGSDGAHAMVDALHYNVGLAELDVSNNNMGDDGARAFCDLLVTCQRCFFQTLHWEDNNLSDDCIELMKTALKQNVVKDPNGNLENQVPPAAPENLDLAPESPLPEMAIAGTSNPSTLTFPTRAVNNKENLIWLDRMISDIQDNRLISIDLTTRLAVNDAAVTKVMTALPENTSVRSIYLCGEKNNLTQTSVASLAGFLEQRTCRLERLYVMGFRTMGKQGFETLIKALVQNQSLRVLSVVSCGITAKCMDVAVDMLIQNESLQRLNLSRNDVGNDGLKRLASALCNENNTTLTSLGLASNGITDEGVVHLVQATSLTELRLEDNKITDEGIRKLLTTCSEQCQYEFLSISGNQISAEGKSEVKWCFPKNARLMM